MSSYQARDYRAVASQRGLAAFTVRVKETDLWLQAQRDLSAEALDSVLRHRRTLEAYIRERPEFQSALQPLPADGLAPPLVRGMLAAGRAADTGPMAAVAGAIAQAVAQDLLGLSPAVAVENGGDIYLALGREATVGIWAGQSPISGKLGLKLAAEAMPVAVCTSSGTVGHSLSLGRADAATVVAADAALADAAATALGNRVQGKADLGAALEWVRSVPGVLGALVIVGNQLAAWGEIELIPIATGKGR